MELRRFLFAAPLLVATIVACSSTTERSFGNDAPATEPPADLGNTADAPDDDPYANDPPPMWCGPKNSATKPPPTPGGSAECPDDKNKPGCPCDELGKTAACWTGLRVNRKLGICKDGVTTCQRASELQNAWGPCDGEVLPKKGATEGSSACKCFSAGQWHIDAPTGCVVPMDESFSKVYWVSTTETASGAECPPGLVGGQIPSKPTAKWSDQSLNVDCAGHFKLCITMKGGDIKNPSASDCTLTQQCVEVDYLKENVDQTLPPLGGWVSTNTACNQYFYTNGGYAEMTVKGLSVLCDAVDDGNGDAMVFHRFAYCPGLCAQNPSAPACQSCTQQGADGSF